jgi:hypothetical protein
MENAIDLEGSEQSQTFDMDILLSTIHGIIEFSCLPGPISMPSIMEQPFS